MNIGNAQAQVKDFMERVGQACPNKPGFPDINIVTLREDLIDEEFDELVTAITSGDITAVYDALIDLLYVTIGAANAFGLDLEPGWNEVVRSNLTKIPGGYMRNDGKWMKGPGFQTPKLGYILDAMKLPQNEDSTPI